MAAPDLSGRTLEELIRLDGRGAVVTGGGRGIGFAISSRLAEAGAQVMIGDLDEAGAKEAADQIVHSGWKASAAQLDASDVGALAAFADRAVGELGKIDIWVNNAGIYPMGPAIDMDEALWDRVLDLNLKGTFFGAQAAAKRMAAAGTGGVIINLASTAGFRGSPNATHYVASKHGVRGLTRGLAAEYAPLGFASWPWLRRSLKHPGSRRRSPLSQRWVSTMSSTQWWRCCRWDEPESPTTSHAWRCSAHRICPHS